MDSIRRSAPSVATTPTGTPPQPTSVLDAPSQGEDMFSAWSKEQYPEWYDSSDQSGWDDVSYLNAAGATLWSAADTASFGIVGYASKALGFDASSVIDFEDPMAKWGSGLGGFVGFVAGGPMKWGAKIAEKTVLRGISRGLLKKTGTKTVDDVVRAAGKTDAAGMLSKKSISDVMKGYRNVVKEAQINPNAWGREFTQNVSRYLDTYLAKGIGKEITKSEARAIRAMFKEGQLFNRPVNDVIGAMVARSGKSTRFNRFIGHAIKDATIFGMIDATFEGVRTIGENTVGEGNYSYDFWAPFWGGVNGLAFASLGWLKPKGKGARWGGDFQAGIKSAFAYNPYKNKNLGQLVSTAKFWDDQLLKQNKDRIIDVGGKKFHLGSTKLQANLETELGDKATSSLSKALLKIKRSEGRSMMRGVASSEAENLAAVWQRMAAGGMLFNAHTFWDMYANDLEADIHDILPHFLIGAWVQRTSNPAKFDMRGHKMNQLRENLTIFGADPVKMSRMPTFDGSRSRLENVYNVSKWEGNERLAEELGIITDDFDASSEPLGPGERSVATKPDPVFDRLYEDLKKRRKYIKNKDDISISQAKELVDHAIKLEPDLKNPLKRDAIFGESYMESTESFERKFKEIIDYVEEADVDNETGIRTAPDQMSKKGDITRVPVHISFEPLMEQARKGELSWLKERRVNERGEEEVVVLEGEEAMIALSSAQDSFNQILLSSRMLTQTKLIEKSKSRNKTIKDENLASEIFQRVRRAEEEITQSYPDRGNMAREFSFAKDASEYSLMILHNHSVKVADKTVQIFKKDFPDRDALVQLLVESGILEYPSGIGNPKIIDRTDNLIISTGRDKTDTSKDSEVAEAKRFLDKVLGLQSIIGKDSYDSYELNKGEKTVKLEDVNALKSFLRRYELNLSDMPDSMFQQIHNFALREVVKGTDLNIEQVNSLFNLAEHKMSRFSTKVAGEAGGFRVYTIRESTSPNKEIAQRYNNVIRKIVKDSNGLVGIEGERDVLDLGALYGMESVLPDMFAPGYNLNARRSIEGLLQAIHESKYPYNTFVDQMRHYVNANDINAIRLEKWLIQAGVLQPTKGKSGFDFNEKTIDKLNDILKDKTDRDGKPLKIYQDISRKMDDTGWTAAFAEEQYQKYEKKARDRLLRDTDESVYDEGITLNEFFKIYRIDDPLLDHSRESGEAQQERFSELVYDTNADSKLLKLDVFDDILSRLYVRDSNNQWAKYSELSNEPMRKLRNGILHHMTGLLGQQKSQVRVNVLKWENGQVSEGFEIMQASRFYNYINGTLQIPYQIVDPRAVIYELSGDGRFIRKNVVDIFGDSENLSTDSRRHLVDARGELERVLRQKITTTSDNITAASGTGEIGFHMMQLLPNMEPIAIQHGHLRNIEQPFREFAETYIDHADVKETVRQKIRNILGEIDSDRPVTPDHYNEALKLLVSKQMLTGSDGDALFLKYLNGTTDIPKLMKRIRLFNSKAFVFTNLDFVGELSTIHEEFGHLDIGGSEGVLRKFMRRRNGRGGFEVSIWNDVEFANLREETLQHLADMGIDGKEWSFQQAIGDAHKKVSSFDSIAYVSRQAMMFNKTVNGNDPYSFTPMKPVINSNGDLSPLLLGKTLFVYSPKLDSFFRSNDVDILLSRSGAKAYNSVEGEGVNDTSIINAGWEQLTSERGYTVPQIEKRSISLESVGLKPEKDYYQHTAKNAVADQNYTTNEESTRWFNDQYRDQLAINLESIETILRDPITTREWLTTSFDNDGTLSSALQESDGLAHLNNIVWFSNLSKDADPMSYSDTVVKNKLYQVYVDKLLNGQRSVTNQYSVENSDRYGGQAILIQVPEADKRLRPTIVTKNGRKLVTGEILLAHHEMDSDIRNFNKDGMGLRFVIAGRKLENIDHGGVFTGEDIFGKDTWKSMMDTAAEGGMNLRSLHEQIKEIASTEEGMDGLSIAIVTRRNPRTRPNDMSILGLKGFLEEQYGNSIAINSLDVANVYEGDYDVDKADYWFAQKDNFYNHVERASQFYVQGIDPTDLMMGSDFNWGDPSDMVVKNVNKMSANLNLYKSSIGRVQKINRNLGHLDKLGYESIGDNEFINGYNNSHQRSKIGETAKILFGGNSGTRKGKPWADDYTITFDYNNLDYFLRSALETQYIIDGEGRINPNITRNMDTWADNVLFETMEKSVSPGQAKEGGADFINDIRSGGNSGGKRVRIFRKIVRVEKNKYKEVDLSPLDKAMIKELMNQYSGLLKVTRDSMYENTGEKTRVSYEDVFDTAEEFFLFHQDINNSLYYRLRKKVIDPEAARKKKWADDPEFIERFGVKEREYEKFKKKKKYFVSTKDAVYEGMKANAVGFYNGERGAPIERVLQRLYKSDPFERSRVREATGEIVGIMDSWYNELIGGADTEDVSNMADRLNSTLKQGKFRFNKKIQVIGSMKKKAAQIANNYKIPYKTKRASLEKINQSINKIEQEITPLIPKKYWKTHKKADLPDQMKFVPVDHSNMKQGTIYMATMESVKNILPGTKGDQSFALSSGGRKLIKEIKALRRIFYGNRTRLKELIDYGETTILTSAQRKLLERFPVLSTYYEIETQLMLQGFNQYGPQFIYNFMMPANNKNNLGVFEGKIMPVPYEATEIFDPSSRYRRGMKFLTSIAKGQMRDLEGNLVNPEVVGLTREGLKLIQFIEAQWHRYFNRKVDMKDLIMQEAGDYSDLRINTRMSDAEMMEAKAGIASQLRLPNVNRDVKRMFTSFKGIQWGQGKDKISHGRDLTNDHLFDFYNDIMAIAGKTEEFDRYRETVNDIEAQMINNEIIDPIEHLSLRSRLDKDVMEIASTVFTGGLSGEPGQVKYVKNITSNPVYILMGGKDYFKGYSFETAARRNIPQRLKDMVELSTNMKNMKNNISPVTSESKKKLDELLEACGG